jgi:hypothetical protein
MHVLNTLCTAVIYRFSYLCTYDLYGPVFPGPNPHPLVQVIDAAYIKSILHRDV